MATRMQTKFSLAVSGLIAVAVILLAVIYFLPIWWVSLEAPNYPPEAFPDGVRIHFHMNGVFNGCKKVESTEIAEEESLDCVHEMDTINHYVGMYPIAAGGPIEKAYSQFLVTLLAIMLIGFAITQPKLRFAVMGVGFAALVGWMYATMYVPGGLKLQTTGYVEALIAALDQGKGEEEPVPAGLSSGHAIIEQLRRSLERSAAAERQAQEIKKLSEKERYIASLRTAFEQDQARKGSAEAWTGSGFQVMSWHYEKNLGRYFNNPAEIKPMAAKMNVAFHTVFVAIIVAMLILLWGARKPCGPIYWLMALVPAALPVFFVIEYSAWLWWFGHNLNEMGAFTVKPFMPTVFGDGKVAQFTTHSYPHIGFGLMLVYAVVVCLAALLRFKQARQLEGAQLQAQTGEHSLAGA